jgi:hypothetical protein
MKNFTLTHWFSKTHRATNVHLQGRIHSALQVLLRFVTVQQDEAQEMTLTGS